MTTGSNDIGVLELNDANLRLSVNDKHSADSPGYATIINDQLILGLAAKQQSRLNPIHSNNQFWHRLSAEPLPNHNNRYRHHADLAYRHLVSAHSDFLALLNGRQIDQFIFALPGNFTREQMSLLLGIVEPSPVKAQGLIDSAVAASALHAQPGKNLHIEAQLHQCVFTLMEAGTSISRQQIEILPNASLLTLQDRFAKSIAEQFVDQSRFDPLHSASTEQSLFDQLPQWLNQSFIHSDMIVEVAGKTAKISRNELITPLVSYYHQIANTALKILGGSGQILVGHQLSKLPGLLESLNELCASSTNTPVVSLDENAIANGVQKNINAIVGDTGELSFIQSLPIHKPVQTAAAIIKENVVSDSDETLPATHVLVGKQAFPLGSLPLFISATPDLSVSATATSAALGILQKQGDQVSLLPQGQSKLRCNNSTVADIISLNAGDFIEAEQVSGQLQFIEVVELN